MAKTEFKRTYNWGTSLRIEVMDAGGLKSTVDRIQHAVGSMIGSRNTFAKLFTLDAPPSPEFENMDALRARLLVEACGLHPEEWAVDEVELPPSFDLEKFREQVKRQITCSKEHAGRSRQKTAA